MIKRIVKMSFHPEKIDEFLTLFESVKNKIRSSEGCEHLELLQDQKNPSIIFTYSYWLEERYLDQYRYSNLFESTWAKTKKLFNDKPEAWSTQLISSITENDLHE